VYLQGLAIPFIPRVTTHLVRDGGEKDARVFTQNLLAHYGVPNIVKILFRI